MWMPHPQVVSAETNTEGRRGGLSKNFGSKVLYIDD